MCVRARLTGAQDFAHGVDADVLSGDGEVSDAPTRIGQPRRESIQTLVVVIAHLVVCLADEVDRAFELRTLEQRRPHRQLGQPRIVPHDAQSRGIVSNDSAQTIDRNVRRPASVAQMGGIQSKRLQKRYRPVRVCARVYMRERERERDPHTHTHADKKTTQRSARARRQRNTSV